MVVRAPLIAPSTAVVYRLDVAATRAAGTPGGGYDSVFRTPVVYDDSSGVRQRARQEMVAVRVPCQVEVVTFSRLKELFAGNAPASLMTLVLHRHDLANLGLLDTITNEPVLKANDRVAAIERRGAQVQSLGPGGAGLYIFEVRPGSWGMGPAGHDLEVVYLHDRPQGLS